MRDLSPILLAQRWLMFIATLQGLLMLGLYRAHLNELWLVTNPVLLVPAWTLVIVLPVLLLLTLSTQRVRVTLLYCTGFAGLLALAGSYVGMQIEPEESSSYSAVIPAYVLCMIIAVFKGLMYVQQRSIGQPLTYPLLFSLSWRNFLVMALALLFVAIVGLLLLLWSALFDAIGVPFFQYLFGRDWFLFPLLGFAFGVGIAVFREMSEIIDSITRLLQGMIRFLLPLLVLMAVVFLVSLAIVGPQTLWDTGFGSGLILWLMAVLLFFVNAVYQDGRGDPAYSPGVHRLIYGGLLGLPVLALMSFYGLWWRFEEYGLTTQRIYGWVVWLLLSLFALGYAIAIVSKRDQWTLGLAQVNTLMGWVVLAVVVLLNTPVADPRVMAVASQLNRLDSGELKIEDMDLAYLKRELARPGTEALKNLQDQYGDLHPGLDWAGRRFPVAAVTQNRSEAFWDNMRRYPADLVIPDGVKAGLQGSAMMYRIFDPLIVAIDLNADEQDEYLLFNLQPDQPFSGWYVYRAGEKWQAGQLQPDRFVAPTRELIDALLDGDLQTEPRTLSDVRVGDVVFRIMPTTHVPPSFIPTKALPVPASAGAGNPEG